MSYGSEPADLVMRYSLEGAELALKLSGLAAKNFAVFAYAVLKDQKKTRGKTHLARMLREQRPLKFFTVPADQMKDFAREAKKRGLLFVPIRSKQKPSEIEIVVFADDAAKVSRVMELLKLHLNRQHLVRCRGYRGKNRRNRRCPCRTSRLPQRNLSRR